MRNSISAVLLITAVLLNTSCGVKVDLPNTTTSSTGVSDGTSPDTGTTSPRTGSQTFPGTGSQTSPGTGSQISPTTRTSPISRSVPSATTAGKQGKSGLIYGEQAPSNPLVHAITSELMKGETEIPVSWLKALPSASDAKMTDIVDAAHDAVYQNPQLGYLGGATIPPDNQVLWIEVPFSREENLQRQKELSNAAQQLLDGFDWEQMSDSEKSRLVHDIVIDTIEYDHYVSLIIEGFAERGDGDDVRVTEASNAYGGLVRNQAVCGGYALSYLLLARAVGLSAYYMEGTVDSGGQPLEHAWNLVWIDGEWVVVDTTWDDLGEGMEPSYQWLHLPKAEAYTFRTEKEDFIKIPVENWP